MALEMRGGCLYYYRGKRAGDRVVKIYVAGGERAQAAAAADRQRRDRQRAAAHADRSREVCVEETGTTLDKFCRASELQLASELLKSGFHIRKGEWRLRYGS